MPGNDFFFFFLVISSMIDLWGNITYYALFFSAGKLSYAARRLKKRILKYFSTLFCLLAAKNLCGKKMILFKDTWPLRTNRNIFLLWENGKLILTTRKETLPQKRSQTNQPHKIQPTHGTNSNSETHAAELFLQHLV